MLFRRFDDVEQLERSAVALLTEHFVSRIGHPRHAVMLTGGNTPQGVYRRIAQHPPVIDQGLHLLISDERLVPADDPRHNFARCAPMIRSLGVPPPNVLRVETEHGSLEQAADDYHRRLSEFLLTGAPITLGILGLGTDGHVASLFDFGDLERGQGRFAVGVRRVPGPDRISVTRELLTRIDRLVFLVTGTDKRATVDRLRNSPRDVVAGRAVEGMRDVAVWFAQ